MDGHLLLVAKERERDKNIKRETERACLGREARRVEKGGRIKRKVNPHLFDT